MPLSQINGSFLREAEREYLDDQQVMEVPFIEPFGKVNQIVLRQEDMPKESRKKSSCYVLIKSWNEVVEKNDFGKKLNQVIQIWSFRVVMKINSALLLLWSKHERTMKEQVAITKEVKVYTVLLVAEFGDVENRDVESTPY
ncbi:hypothetical protein ACB092_07G097700 [Castanea dentata]